LQTPSLAVELLVIPMLTTRGNRDSTELIKAGVRRPDAACGDKAAPVRLLCLPAGSGVSIGVDLRRRCWLGPSDHVNQAYPTLNSLKPNGFTA